MEYFTIIILLLSFHTCFAVSDDSIIIDGKNMTDAPITEINEPASTVPPPNTTTSVTTTTTTTTTPVTPPTTTTKTTTTPKPITTTLTTSTTVTTTTKPTSSTKPPPPTPSPAPNSTTAPITTTASPHHERKFDGPSFVGGIILALGMVAIGFVAFKFYKARTEMNYHTL